MTITRLRSKSNTYTEYITNIQEIEYENDNSWGIFIDVDIDVDINKEMDRYNKIYNCNINNSDDYTSNYYNRYNNNNIVYTNQPYIFNVFNLSTIILQTLRMFWNRDR